MKNLLLLGLCFTASVSLVNAQSSRLANPGPKVPFVKTVAEPAPLRAKAAATAAPAARAQGGSYGTKIGKTWYDLQSNGSSGNRIVRNADGTISATWTEVCASGAQGTWPSRGAGYNYYDGTTWTKGNDGTCDESGADFGVFTSRVGWPEIVTFPSGKEMIVAHTPLTAISRPQKGQGGQSSWTQTTLTITGGAAEGDTWPRVVASGSTVHAVASSSATVNGVDAGLAYYRSTDEGASWTEIPLPGMSAANFNDIGGDTYAIHANGNNVAISAGSFESNWVVWQSSDAGQNWNTHVVRAFDPDSIQVSAAGDTLYLTNDSYHAVIVDNNGTAHVWTGAFIVGPSPDPTTNNGWATNTIYPQTEGMWYWNSNMGNMNPRLIVEEREDIYPAGDPSNWIGNGTYVTPRLINSYQGSQTGMPNAALAPNGDIYVVYSGIVEGTSNTGDSTGQSFRDLYVMRGQPVSGGIQWSQPINIAETIAAVGRTDFEEDVFPSVAHEIGSDNMLHVLWQSDAEPGLAVRIDEDPETENSIIHYGFDVTTPSFANGVLITYLGRNEAASFVNKMEVFPNPTTGLATLKIDMKQAAANVTVKVTNLLGQEVASIKPSALNAGANTISIDLSGQASGMYLYTVSSDKFTQTSRVIKN